ncbi:MAG TPA: zinc ribbon domain-containing protein [Candidatus Limnocylindrales bacterium]|nr:zinc ribbon domain-containing protein [Candidatus Limnocylindrales bacterium]
MPTYDYVCGQCGHRFEVIHGVHVEGPTECPNCHGGPVRKAFSAPSIVFKGSGWAKKDRSSTSKPASSSSSNSSSNSSSEGSTSTDPKGGPEAKPADAKAASAKPSSDAASSTSSGAAAD